MGIVGLPVSYKEKTKANQLAAQAIRDGKLVRPRSCSRCRRAGNPEPFSTGRILAHHEDYSKPLEITWLCTGCHAERHSEIHRELTGRPR